MSKLIEIYANTDMWVHFPVSSSTSWKLKKIHLVSGLTDACGVPRQVWGNTCEQGSSQNAMMTVGGSESEGLLFIIIHCYQRRGSFLQCYNEPTLWWKFFIQRAQGTYRVIQGDCLGPKGHVPSFLSAYCHWLDHSKTPLLKTEMQGFCFLLFLLLLVCAPFSLFY